MKPFGTTVYSRSIKYWAHAAIRETAHEPNFQWFPMPLEITKVVCGVVETTSGRSWSWWSTVARTECYPPFVCDGWLITLCRLTGGNYVEFDVQTRQTIISYEVKRSTGKAVTWHKRQIFEWRMKSQLKKPSANFDQNVKTRNNILRTFKFKETISFNVEITNWLIVFMQVCSSHQKGLKESESI